MGGGEAASGEGSDLGRRAVVMAVASVFGVIVVALPFFYLRGNREIRRMHDTGDRALASVMCGSERTGP